MLGFLSFAFFAVGLVLSYWIWIRPRLRARPSLAEFYAMTDSWWAAIWAKLRTIRTRLASLALMIAGGLVSVHDFLLPVATGIDWSPVTSKVPEWAWPPILFGVGALFLWLRNLTAKTQEKQLEAVASGASVQEAMVIAGVEPKKADDDDD